MESFTECLGGNMLGASVVLSDGRVVTYTNDNSFAIYADVWAYRENDATCSGWLAE